jgi:uncharacterized protein YdhG (YjbR/CyaY superfamily)
VARSDAPEVAAYLETLPADRRAAIAAVREMIRRNLPDGYTESVQWGMIAYTIPLERNPDTYNRQPLCYAALASQKNYCSLHLMGVYSDPAQEAALRRSFAAAKKKLDMGKSCVRFRSADDLPLEDIGRLIASTPPDAFIARHEALRKRR